MSAEHPPADVPVATGDAGTEVARPALDPEVERGAACFHGMPRGCESYRCGSNCSMRFDRMHPCPACLLARITDLRAELADERAALEQYRKAELLPLATSAAGSSPEDAGTPVRLVCTCGHLRFMHGDVAGDAGCRQCRCGYWRPVDLGPVQTELAKPVHVLSAGGDMDAQDELEALREAVAWWSKTWTEARAVLTLVADRLDEFTYGEFATLFDDDPSDQLGDTYIATSIRDLPALDDEDRAAISSVVHQGYHMPDVFAAVESIVRKYATAPPGSSPVDATTCSCGHARSVHGEAIGCRACPCMAGPSVSEAPAHPKFEAFKARHLENPAIRAAYEEIKERRDAEDGLSAVNVMGTWLGLTDEQASRIPSLRASTTADEGGTLTEGPAVRRCRDCGCTDDRACSPPCWWVEADLCSSCRDGHAESRLS